MSVSDVSIYASSCSFSLTVGSDMQPYGPVPLPASAAFHGGRSPGSICILVQNNSLPAAQTYLEPYREYSPDGLCPHTALEWNLKVLSVWMCIMINNILCLSGLYQFSAVHNIDLVNHLGYNCQVMSDQHQRCIMLLHQLFHKL